MAEDREQERKEFFEKILEASELVEVKLFNELMRRVTSGETLKPSELKVFNQLKIKFQQQIGQKEKIEIIGSFDEAAEYCGVSKRTINWHLSRGNLKQESDGSFKKDELDQWLTSRGRKNEKMMKGSFLVEQAEWEMRWRKARALNMEYQNKVMKKEYVSKAKMRSEFIKRIQELKRGLLVLGRRIGPRLARKTDRVLKETIMIVDEEVYRLLENWARPIEIRNNGES